jgi:hypothetical protein
MKAMVPFELSGRTMLKFIDCVAVYTTDSDPPYGYGESISIRDGVFHNPVFSQVAGLIGGQMEVSVYLEQFNIPCCIGDNYHFWVGPGQVMDACVQAVKEELYPPEYVI